MDLRLADAADFDACDAIDASVQSTHVWQLRLAYDPVAPQPAAELGGVLYLSRLPRPVTIGPASAEPLADLWNRAADVLIADDEQGVGGYVLLTVGSHALAATIARIAVVPTLRRGGIGGLLLRGALQWARAANYDRVTAHCSARNYPTASFYGRYGFRFAGYSEAFYPRGEIALFWQRPV